MFAHEIAQTPSEVQPRWLRVPAACAYSGLPRSSLYRLLSENVIKSASLCSPGKTRGVRIVDRLELDALLSGLTGKQTAPRGPELSSTSKRQRAARKGLGKNAARSGGSIDSEGEL
jgi:hypothetical protein